MTARAMVRFLAAATTAAILALGVTTVTAGATVVRAPSASDCEAIQSVGDGVDSGGNVFGKQAEQLAESFDDTASNVENKKLKKSLQTMADFYDDLAGADNLIAAGKITVSEGKRYAKALKVFAKANLDCIATQITLPDNVTLPGGVTLPSLPR